MPAKAKTGAVTPAIRTKAQKRSPKDRDFVDALARGLEVIQAFSAERPEMTLSEVADKAGISAARARRALLTLKALGYVGAIERRFLLRPKVLSLGSAFLDSMNVKDIADPYLRDLADAFHDSASMTILDDIEIVYIAHIASARELRYRMRIGSRLPAYASSMGHVLLANLAPENQEAILKRAPFPRFTSFTTVTAKQLRITFQTARSKGYAVNINQVEYGSRAVAVPIRDTRGQVVAAINCSAESPRVEIDVMVKTRLPALLEVAKKIETTLARHPALARSLSSGRD